jgi:predicted O-methyltransferase YrrM
MMDALILSRSAVAPTDQAAVASIAPGFDLAAVDQLTLSGGAYGKIKAADRVCNIYTPRQPASYDRVFIGPSVVLFDNAWALAFLRHALSLVKPGGTLQLVRTKSSARGGRELLSLETARRYLGGEETAADASVVLVVKRGDALPPSVKSTFSAYIDDEAELTETLASYYRNKSVTAEQIAQMEGISQPSNPIGGVSALLDPSHPSAENLERQRLATGSVDDGFATYVASLNPYMFDGVRYKHALVSYLIRTCAPELASKPIDVVDVGAAFGLLPMELALDDRFQVRSAVSVELGLGYAIGADRIVRRCGGLQERFRFAHAQAETFEFKAPLHVVSFIGSLLYVAKGQLHPVLDKVWDSLAPGGLLIIHENIRRPSFNQADLMFYVDEIDALMERYGPVRYFMSTAAVELTREQAGDKSVFRVVKKPEREAGSGAG